MKGVHNKKNSADAANMARHFAAAKAAPRLLHSLILGVSTTGRINLNLIKSYMHNVIR